MFYLARFRRLPRPRFLLAHAIYFGARALTDIHIIYTRHYDAGAMQAPIILMFAKNGEMLSFIICSSGIGRHDERGFPLLEWASAVGYDIRDSVSLPKQYFVCHNISSAGVSFFALE